VVCQASKQLYLLQLQEFDETKAGESSSRRGQDWGRCMLFGLHRSAHCTARYGYLVSLLIPGCFLCFVVVSFLAAHACHICGLLIHYAALFPCCVNVSFQFILCLMAGACGISCLSMFCDHQHPQLDMSLCGVQSGGGQSEGMKLMLEEQSMGRRGTAHISAHRVPRTKLTGM
jgi:hypothetical protein